MPDMPRKGLYAITDCGDPDRNNFIKSTDAILSNGAVLLQYRNKVDPPDEKHSKAAQIRLLCHQHDVPFIINDDLQLAIELGADGVHLGRNDTDCRRARAVLGPECIIGISCYNNLQRARDAVRDSADYVAFGAFFPTRSKEQTVPANTALLQDAARLLPVPVAAIGGITPENGSQLITAGANFLAVISGLYASRDPALATRQYVRLFDQDHKA